MRWTPLLFALILVGCGAPDEEAAATDPTDRSPIAMGSDDDQASATQFEEEAETPDEDPDASEGEETTTDSETEAETESEGDGEESVPEGEPAATDGDGPFTLRLNRELGSKTVYDYRQEFEGEVGKVVVVGTLESIVAAKDADSITERYDSEFEVQEASGMFAQMSEMLVADLPQGESEAKLSRRGALIEGDVALATNPSLTDADLLPEEAIAIGDSWSTDIEIGTMTTEFVAVETVNGRRAAKLVTETELDEEQMGGLPIAGAPLVATRWIDLATGELLKSESGGELMAGMKMRVTMTARP